MKLLTNHIGYECVGPKQAVLQTKTRLNISQVQLVSALSGEVIQHLPLLSSGTVDQWSQGYFHSIDFSEFTTVGRYFLRLDETQSQTFEIGEGLLMTRCFSDLLHYFKGQRCAGIFDQHDQKAVVLGTDKTVDVHGGWYDASGDLSKYFSHLSFANYMNPQQIPMIVWNMFKGLDLLKDNNKFAKYSAVRLQEEAIFGADFLQRMLSEEGYFYMTVFDKWSKDPEQRDLCAYENQTGDKTESYQAAFRQGAGIAIASLAVAYRKPTGGEFSAAQYLASAERAYWHLVEHNESYCDDNQSNIIDEYCALIAAVELYKSTTDEKYLQEARSWAAKLSLRQQSDDLQLNFWSANSDGSRPYFHGAEAGLPVIALTQYLEIETNSEYQQKTKQTIIKALKFELAITSEVFNPFAYPRQYVKSVNEAKRSAFFIAHNNESGYWWQGENARLGSLAAMVNLVKPHIEDASLNKALASFAQSSLNWIVGLNPYDMCMLDGAGFNNPDYLPELGFFNAKGGVCNGITGGFDNELDIAFKPEGQADDMLQNWRWGEQWIPHGGWFLLAIMAQSA
ncbi:glycoside hydrolase family 9 protein [Psychromonas sp. Urea-02u-13]|uniref:glycoside hydrolase family 9 protein n=1 Tax=Psychromonas sp. Urea-02u-13 TaxID=2058326 RepID=UPI000C334108|nr:glycoside hydrolase family 9 protein [Psychromonas sp. Urea-02u-13]PKG39763.1 chitobiase [Psychromonas sp. Urea-02u-13]